MVRLSAYTSRAWVPALVGELRSCKLHSVAKKKKKNTQTTPLSHKTEQKNKGEKNKHTWSLIQQLNFLVLLGKHLHSCTRVSTAPLLQKWGKGHEGGACQYRELRENNCPNYKIQAATYKKKQDYMCQGTKISKTFLGAKLSKLQKKL